MSLPDAIGRLVARCCRHAMLVSILGAVLAALSLAFVADRFAISTDTESLISSEVAWRRNATAFDRAFPGKSDQVVVVVDGRTAELAEAGASALAARLQARPDLFREVAKPAGGAFFDQEGLLFLPQAELASTLDGLVKAQPLIGPLAADPSLRGVMSSLATGLEQTAQGSVQLSTLDRPMAAIATEIESALASRRSWMAWSALVDGAETPADRRRLVILEPKLDYSQLMPGLKATQAARAAAASLGLTPERGVTVRITGPVPLDDEQLGSLEEGALPIAAAMLVAVTGVLWLALRSPRLILAVLATVFTGLFVTAALGLAAFGRFNLIFTGDHSAELGYRVAQRAAGRGLATATVRELCHLAAAEFELRTIRAATSVQNSASQKVLTNAGFVPEGPADPAHLGGKPGTWYERVLADS